MSSDVSDLDLAVGCRIELIRTCRVMALGKLAGEAGIALEWLAAIEGGMASATLAEVVRIAAALDESAARVLVPALAKGRRPWAEALDDASWIALLGRFASRVRDPRRRTMLLECARMLEDLG